MFTNAGASSALAEVTGAADNLRTGWYPDEPRITPGLLSGGGFQQIFKDPLKGQIYAQPLTANGTLLVVTEENWAYGVEPYTGAVVWEKQFGTAVSAGEEPSATIKCPDLKPRVGITGTPVIDTEHGIAYFVAHRYVSGSSGPIAWYMHAIELTSGNEVANFPVKIEGKAQNIPGVSFDALQELQRPALLMLNGVVYAGFGSHCDHTPYEGWVIGVSSLGQITTRWATSGKGGAIWQSGGGLISDGPGRILFATGNGSGPAGEGDPPKGAGKAPPEGRLGESVVTAEVGPGGELEAKDFFSPFNNKELDLGDIDLGSSAPLALPSPYFGTPGIPHLLVQDGKSGYVYLLNRDDLGGMGQGPSAGDKVVQKTGPYGGVWDGAAVWPGDGGYVYIPTVAPAGSSGGSAAALLFFRYGLDKAGAPALSLAAESSETFAFGSGSPIVTSAGTASGSAILWTTRCPEYSCEKGKLVAYNPVPLPKGALQVLWEAPMGTGTKFARPNASNGYVYVGNREGFLYGFGHPETKAEREARERAEREARERPEREARERAEREAAEHAVSAGTGGTLTTAAVSAPGGSSPATRPAPSLTKLKIHAGASRFAAHGRRLLVSYALSAAATVEVVIFRRVTSHRCRSGASTCIHWVRTKLTLKVRGHAGGNVLTIRIGALPVGSYRLAATPVARSGARGSTQYVRFTAIR
jgi:outer membrane protein assembly factor BamB